MNRLLAPITLAAAIAFSALSCTTEQANSPTTQAAVATATTVATTVLDSWLASHPVSASRHSKRLSLADQGVKKSMTKARAEVFDACPELTAGEIERVVAKVYAAKFNAN